MIKYIVEYGFVNREYVTVSYECDMEFDVLEKAQLYVDSYSYNLNDDEYFTIWECDTDTMEYTFMYSTLTGDMYE